MVDKTLTKEIERLEREGAFNAKVFETTKQVNNHYQWLRYEGGADNRGFGVDKLLHSMRPNDDTSTFAHRWYSAGVEAAYLAVKDRPDVPEDVKQGLASYAGLPINIEKKESQRDLF